MKQLFSQLAEIWTAGTPAQRALGALSILVVLLGIGGSVYVSTRPDMSLLFGNLEPSDASSVVEEVRAANVAAEVRNGGRDVFVPRQHVSEMRMLVSAAGLPKGMGSGWELFDKSSFGVSDFVQNVTYRRALQGALARDIASFDAVENASVNITRPRRSAFLNQDRRPKASVIVHTRSGRRLPQENVEAIAHLIAGAVEGLESSDVKVMDSQMRLLSDGGEDTLAANADKHLQFRLREEDVRRKRAQEMLDRMQVRADVRVGVELEFQSIRETSETLDKPQVMSETVESRTSKPADASGGGSVGTESKINDGLSLPSGVAASEEADDKTTTTYASGRSVRSTEINTPRVSRLAVSLVVHKDHQAQVKEIEELVKAAVLFDETRNDTFRSMVHEFESEAAGALPEEEGGQALLPLLIEHGLSALAVLGALFLLLKVLKTAERGPKAAPVAATEQRRLDDVVPPTLEEMEEAVVEEPVPNRLEDMVRSSVETNPGAATRVLRTWLKNAEPN